MKTKQEIEQIRNSTIRRLNMAGDTDRYRIVVGMATCGIAAGAKPVFEAFRDEVKKRSLDNVEVTMTGCIGICRLEPVAEVYGPEGKEATYINMSAAKVSQIVAEHIVNGRICEEYCI